jgi:hypothetical protein
MTKEEFSHHLSLALVYAAGIIDDLAKALPLADNPRAFHAQAEMSKALATCDRLKRSLRKLEKGMDDRNKAVEREAIASASTTVPTPPS